MEEYKIIISEIVDKLRTQSNVGLGEYCIDKIAILEKIIEEQNKLLSDISKLNKSNQLNFVSELHQGPLQSIPEHLGSFQFELNKLAIDKKILKLSNRLVNEINDDLAAFRDQILNKPDFLNPKDIKEILVFIRQLIRAEFPGIKVESQFSIHDKYWGDKLVAEYYNFIFVFFRETINNARKHGRATTVQIRVIDNKESLNIMTIDNGNGFHEGENKHSPINLADIPNKETGLGLKILLNYINSYRGKIIIQPFGSELGGARIEATINKV